MKVRRSCQGNRKLKDVLLGAARSAIAQANNPFADKYQSWSQEQELHPANVHYNIARALASTMWSLWKSGQTYDPVLVNSGGVPSRG